jgi:PEP-CTERM motif
MRLLGISATAILLAPMSANALLIDANLYEPCPPIGGIVVACGSETSQNDINDVLDAMFDPDLVDIYTQNVGGAETGSVAGSYTTTFSNTAGDPEDALIEYVGGPIADADYLLVKDGNASPAWWLFNISAWNGTDDLELINFWAAGTPGTDDARGAISHVTLYGGTTTQVPEPMTLSLLGVGLLAFGFTRRRLNRNS